MPIDLILYAVVAVVLVFWLRNTLGTRHGEERQRENPLTKAEREKTSEPVKDMGRIVDVFDDEPVKPASRSMEYKTFPGMDLDALAAKGVFEILKYDNAFDPSRFVTGVKDAFPMVIEAFAQGDTETLEELLAPKVFKSFADVIDARKLQGETISSEIHAVRKVQIIEARLAGSMAYITCRITADETCVIRDAQGVILSGNPDRVTELVDVWTFGRNTKSNDPTWLVYETRDDVVEEPGTSIPIPDSNDF